MYLSHYNLTEKPFQINPDPKFMWLGETHKEALAILKYGILDNRGFLLLVGDVGTGKTTLVNGLLNSLDENTIVATIPDPGLEKLDFYNFLANAFEMDKKFSSKGDFLVHFIHFLHKVHAENKKVLVIIDESQRLTGEMFEEIRLLSNIEKQDARLLNIFLVGQSELNETLAKTENRALLQRITTRYNIGPLKKDEIGEYIKFRLGVAGTHTTIFRADAVREVVSFSKCYPRLINIICDQALLTGFVRNVKKIDAGIIKECAKELRPPKRSLKERGKKLVNLGKKFQNAVDIGNQIPERRMTAVTVLSVFLLIVAGFFYFSGRNSKDNLNTQHLKTGSAFSTPQTKINTPSRQRLRADTKGEKISTTKKQDAVKTTSRMQIGNQKDLPNGKRKQSDRGAHNDSLSFAEEKLIIHFPLNSNEFTDKAYELLDRFVATIFKYPDATVIIKGYTDSSGNYNYNKRLSIFRANIVKSYFVGQGVSPRKIKTFGMGPENPIASNTTVEGRNANRRIEIELKESKPLSRLNRLVGSGSI